jgi:two-component system sensor histidine kinase BaeS
MNTLRSRFIISHLLPILATAPLVAAALTYIIETQFFLANLSNSLSESANLISDLFEVHPEIWSDQEAANKIATRLSYDVEAQIVLFSPDGNIFAIDPELESPQEIWKEFEGLGEAQKGNPSITITYGWFTQSGEALIPVFSHEKKLIGIIGLTQTLEGTASQFSRLRNLILLILGLEIFFGLGVGILLASMLQRPIIKTVNSVTHIAYGQSTEEIELEGPQEIQQLIQGVNFLAKRLKNMEEMRRRLLANLVHELGRPLGAILSAIHALKQPAGEDPIIRKELLDGMENEISRMQPMLDDLAQLHGQILGTLKLNLSRISLNEWLSSEILHWRALAVDKGLLWETNIQENLPQIEIDPDRMAQVIGNLISNAIKYTSSTGKIALTAKSTKEKVLIQVSDSGLGISNEEQQRIFEPFYRSRENKRFPQGLGLGLTIARDIVNAHGGNITLKSVKGKGSDFVISLPIK